MADTTKTKSRGISHEPLNAAGAPEIEITPAMIEAGLGYLEDRGINSLTSMTTYPEFVMGFIRAINRAR